MQVAATNTAEDEVIATESDVLFNTNAQLTYDTTITTNVQPSTETVQFVMDVPQSFRNSVDSGSTIEAFAMVEQTSSTGATFVVFDLIPSTFDPTANTVTMQIPQAAFTMLAPNAPMGEFQAVITLASSPGSGRRRLLRRLQTCPVTMFNCPLEGIDCATATISTSFMRGGTGNQYYAVDFSVPANTVVLAAADGSVVAAGSATSWGMYVIVRHSSDSASTLYGFLSRVAVAVGSTVSVGDTIGASGMSGSAGGPLLHLELVPSGTFAATKERVDPIPCINAVTNVPSMTPSQSLLPSESTAPSM